MDWLKLFTLLITVSSVVGSAEGTRKKIRIHIPQKVKHIHHHKKIYITNHSASSQYAPAYLPTAESMSLPTAVALPTVAGLVPLKPVPLYEERKGKDLRTVASSESSLLPQYQARGFYGPAPTWENTDFDLVPPPGPSGPTASAIPTAFDSDSAPAASPSAKRIKIIKVEPGRKKKIIRKKKPKRIIIQDTRHQDDEHPISSFHEQFYADVEGGPGTIRKIKKPKRVEKIVDGDTEHIHTYSEEHIHKLVFDDQHKIAGIAGMDPSGAGIAALAAQHPLLPIKNSQALLSLEPSLHQPLVTNYNGGGNIFSDLGHVGSMGTPSSLEYSNYNPREVTHDHVFHDHGEIPPHLDISKEHFGSPPKVSFTNHGAKNRGKTRQKPKWSDSQSKPSPNKLNSNDFSYYENMYSAPHRRPVNRPSYNRPKYHDDSSPHSDNSYDDFASLPSFRPRDKKKIKHVGVRYHGKSGYRPHSTADVPFSTSSTVIHDIPQKPPRHSFSGVRESTLSSLANFKDPFKTIKDTYANNFDYDAYALPSTNENFDAPSWTKGKEKKKSISTQNISFGGQDHKTVVDHLADVSNMDSVVTNHKGSTLRHHHGEDKSPMEGATPSPIYSITEFSPAHEYYTSMAIKAFRDNSMTPESSDNNFQIVEAPSSLSEPMSFSLTSTPHPSPSSQYYSEGHSTSTTHHLRGGKLSKRHNYKNKHKERQTGERNFERFRNDDDREVPTGRGKLRYGDRLAGEDEDTRSF